MSDYRKGSCHHCDHTPRGGLHIKELKCNRCSKYFCQMCGKSGCPQCGPGYGYVNVKYIQN